MRPLLMIPGPIEVSPEVQAAVDGPPDSHTAPALIAAFGDALRGMRRVWRAAPDAQPFVLAGSGSLAMDVAVHNLLEPGKRALVVHSGYFSARMASMLERRGVAVSRVVAEPGDAPSAEQVAAAFSGEDAVFVTHVDTSTGVRTDVQGIAGALAGRALLVVDGVCATVGEDFDMAGLGADVYLTASQKAVGLPPGLALMVVSGRALAARQALRSAPPLSLDWQQWLPVMQAYEEGRPSYFATPATPLVRGLAVGLAQVEPLEAAARHAAAGVAMRRAWGALGLRLLPRPGLEANTLSAIWLPEGLGPELVGKVAARGVLVAGGLLPDIRARYFRVGHMGWTISQPALLRRTVDAVAGALNDCGYPCSAAEAVEALGG